MRILGHMHRHQLILGAIEEDGGLALGKVARHGFNSHVNSAVTRATRRLAAEPVFNNPHRPIAVGRDRNLKRASFKVDVLFSGTNTDEVFHPRLLCHRKDGRVVFGGRLDFTGKGGIAIVDGCRKHQFGIAVTRSRTDGQPFRIGIETPIAIGGQSHLNGRTFRGNFNRRRRKGDIHFLSATHHHDEDGKENPY